MQDGEGLNDRQRRFCQAYATNGGNGRQAAIDAGYSPKTAKEQAARLLTNVNIVRYIRQLQDRAASARITTMQQVQAFWSDIINDPQERTADRLKASELFGRAAGAFLHVPTDGRAELWANYGGDDVIIYLPQLEDPANAEIDDFETNYTEKG